jgi:hypothetical protein
MSIIPLDLQRRCERRWAAQFSRPIPSVAPRNPRPVRETLQIAEPAKSKERPAGLKGRLETFTDRGERGTEAPRPVLAN